MRTPRRAGGAGLAPNVFHYTAAVGACRAAAAQETALQLLQEMRARSVAPNLLTYTNLVCVQFN